MRHREGQEGHQTAVTESIQLSKKHRESTTPVVAFVPPGSHSPGVLFHPPKLFNVVTGRKDITQDFKGRKKFHT